MQIEITGYLGIGGIDLLLEGVGLSLECLGGFATIALASETDFVWDGQDKAVVGSEIFVGK